MENQRKAQEVVPLVKRTAHNPSSMDVAITDAVIKVNGAHGPLRHVVDDDDVVLEEVRDDMVQLKSVVERLVHDSFGKLHSLADE